MRFDAKGLDAGLRQNRAMRAALKRVGEAVAAGAEEGRDDRRLPIRVVASDRGVRVLNANPEATLEEWGSASRAPQGTLRRGVRAAGLRLDEAP